MKPNIVPVLQYDDAPAAAEWLVRVLGFAKDGSALRFGQSPVIVRPIGLATGAWSGVRQGTYVYAPGASAATKRDVEGYVWSVGAEDLSAGSGGVALVPEILCRSPASAAEWLRSDLGFETTFEVSGPDGMPMHIEMRLGDSTLFVGRRTTDPGFFGDVSQFVNLIVDDCDGHHENASAAGANVVIAPRDTPFGARFYAVRDPEQMLWWVSTYRPAKAGAARSHG
jgi:uncharacterized glyoxalase superfamily protein PhnB